MKIIDEHIDGGVETWQKWRVKKTDVTRVRKIFAYLPLCIRGKYVWLKSVYILQRLHFVSREEFSEWDYRNYWTKPVRKWNKEKILKDNDKRINKVKEAQNRLSRMKKKNYEND